MKIVYGLMYLTLNVIVYSLIVEVFKACFHSPKLLYRE